MMEEIPSDETGERGSPTGVIIIVMANVDQALLFAGHLALPFCGLFY